MDVLKQLNSLRKKAKVFKIVALAFIVVIAANAVIAFLPTFLPSSALEYFNYLGDSFFAISIGYLVILCVVEVVFIIVAATSKSKYKKFALDNAEAIEEANKVIAEQKAAEAAAKAAEEAAKAAEEAAEEAGKDPATKVTPKVIEEGGLLKSILMKVIAPFCDGGSTFAIHLPSLIKMMLGKSKVTICGTCEKVELKVPSIISSFLSGKPILVYKGEQQVGKIEKKSIISMILSKTKVAVYKADNKVIEIDLPRLLFVAIFKSTYVINNIEEGYQKTIQTPSPIKMIISGTEITIK